MQVCGIIAEYNPFHRGHAYHAAEARRLSGADFVVAVMSTAFTQRGEPAFCDPWRRAEMALRQGVDCVIALPVGYSLQPADGFALGGVQLLEQLGVVTHLAFGCEDAALDRLQPLGQLLREEPEPLKALIRARLDAGLSWPRARAEAAAAYLQDPSVALLLNGSNNILALNYLAALDRLGSALQPVPVARIGADYLDPDATQPIASATAVRRAWFADEPLPDLPEATAELLQQAATVSPEQLLPFVLYALRSDRTLAARLPDMAEGLENKLRQAADVPHSWASLVQAVQSKRYPAARIQRALCHAALGMTHAQVQLFRQHQPCYARILGFRKQAQPLIAAIAAQARCPVVTRPGQFAPSDASMQQLWQLDRRADDLYSLLSGTPAGRTCTSRLITL